ncbi:MAG: hypothetical protein MSG64_19380 [Pyrinomonadaceae bacterium MAG19_C2-C3]|nr:hypothetical protein [Pyrinomonadaceae bacterium MAG19_C2-C3]
MRAVILLPDGVGVRNFLLSPFLKQMGEAGEVCVLRAMPQDDLTGQLANLPEEWRTEARCEDLLPHRETPASLTLRNALAYAQMHWAQTKSMRLRLQRTRPVKGSWRTQASFRLARVIGRVAASPGGIALLDRWHGREVARMPETEHYRKLFREFKPSVLFCSHQRPGSILPPVLAAKSLGIPTATFIFSWDNLTSKGRIAAPFDFYFVWSEQMRDELLRYYPDVDEKQIHIVGTPQFDPYDDASLLWSRAEFFARISADTSRPLLCYSGGDVGNYPPEPEFVRILMRQIREGHIKGNPQVLLRPAPVDDGARYDSVRREFPELIYAQPAWVRTSEKWSQILPTLDDVNFLTNLTYHADLNINLASTMTLDFALRDKPIVNVAFDVDGVPPYGVPIWDYAYDSEHYRPVVELGAVRCACCPEELAEHINAYLADSSLDRENRERLIKLQIGVALGRSTERVVEALRQIEKLSNVESALLRASSVQSTVSGEAELLPRSTSSEVTVDLIP